MNARQLSILICLLLAATPSVSSEKWWFDTADAQMQIIARDGLQRFLSSIPSDERIKLGLLGTAADYNATIGKGFRVCVILPDTIMSFAPYMLIQELLYPTPLWYFPVIVEEKIHCILIVDWMESQWEAVSLGQAPLAKEYGELQICFPPKDGFHTLYIRQYQSGCEFFAVHKDGYWDVIPLKTTAYALGLVLTPQDFDYTPVSLPELMDSITPVMLENMRQFRR